MGLRSGMKLDERSFNFVQFKTLPLKQVILNLFLFNFFLVDLESFGKHFNDFYDFSFYKISTLIFTALTISAMRARCGKREEIAVTRMDRLKLWFLNLQDYR